MKKVCLFCITLCLALSSCMKDGYNSWYPDSGYMPEPGTEPGNGDTFQQRGENPFVSTAENAVSSFSVDADGASYAYMRRCLREIGFVQAESVRLEEYLNYFPFDYPEPAAGETLGINAELAACPWAPSHHLLRLGLKGKSLKENEIPAANYILLIDTSGSMYGDDRIGLLRTGLCALVDCLRPDDRVAIITYSGSVRKLLESTLVSKGKEQIKRAIRSLSASGCTAGGEAMKMAYEEASAHYTAGGNNRIIMCTDGDFNVGVSSTEALVEMVESYQEKGIYLSIMGFGTGNYQDSRMESLSNHGNGTYTYIDSEEEMLKVFVNERSHFWSVANDTKCQVRFNPEVVAQYRLLGYENRLMTQEEFQDSKKDAGEIGAGQNVTALYEIVFQEHSDPEKKPVAATFEARYKRSLKDAESRSLSLNVCQQPQYQPSRNMDFAAGVSAFALILRKSSYKGDATVSMAYELVEGSLDYDPNGYRAELLQLMDKYGR